MAFWIYVYVPWFTWNGILQLHDHKNPKAEVIQLIQSRVKINFTSQQSGLVQARLLIKEGNDSKDQSICFFLVRKPTLQSNKWLQIWLLSPGSHFVASAENLATTNATHILHSDQNHSGSFFIHDLVIRNALVVRKNGSEKVWLFQDTWDVHGRTRQRFEAMT